MNKGNMKMQDEKKPIPVSLPERKGTAMMPEE